MDEKPVNISAVDLFCGAGGLSYGLAQAGIHVAAGIDIEERARYAYETNHPGAKFLCWDITKKRHTSVEKLFQPGAVRLLAGCAPCPPFSNLTQEYAQEGNKEKSKLLDHFGRLLSKIRPELVLMENVPGLATKGRHVFEPFLKVLKAGSYHVSYSIIRCEHYGIPQSRKRLLLIASRLGEIQLPVGHCKHPEDFSTVRQTISHLPPLRSGEADPDDRLHRATQHSALILKKIRASRRDGGSMKDWPEELLPERVKKVGLDRCSYATTYARLWWDRPSSTISTYLAPGSGRLFHPEQDRMITSREAALLQTFPPEFEFWPPNRRLSIAAVKRLIGNAVPPRLGYLLGQAIVQHVRDHT